ncbi:MAG: hypothetical protein ABIT04_09750 [Novosphingobium sp.]
MKLAAAHDTVTLPLPAAIRLRSAADRRLVDAGLEIDASPVAGMRKPVRLGRVPSGVWVAHVLPGTGARVANDATTWGASATPYRFAVDDAWGRFLPLRLSAALPFRGAVRWAGWSGWTDARRGQARPILLPGADPATIPDYLPLFPGPGWKPEPGLADVRAQLAIRETGGALRNAGWAVATVGLGGTTIGLGVADGEGRLVVAFPYPALPDQTPAEAAQGRPLIAWSVSVQVHCGELAVGLAAGGVPELQSILAQLDSPPLRALATIVGAQAPLPDQQLVLGRTLVLRTEISAGKPSSSLFLKSP